MSEYAKLMISEDYVERLFLKYQGKIFTQKLKRVLKADVG